MDKPISILLAGPSGVGKTTIANFLAQELGIKFISGSVSDLLPQTKDMAHADMLARDSKELYMEDLPNSLANIVKSMSGMNKSS